MGKRQPPVRMCIGCNEHKLKKELIRVVKNKEGEISVDLTGKKPGRGAYLCKNVSCLKNANKNNRLKKTFNMEIDDDLMYILEKEVEKLNGECL